MKLETAETFRIRPESRNIEEVLIKAYRDGEVIKMGGSSFVVLGHDCVTFVLQAVKCAGPAAWTGEGLPPVGTVCEFMKHNSPPAPKGQWTVGDIRYVSDCYVIIGGEGCEHAHHPRNCSFRPVRTPEQIAEEERIASAYAMCAVARSLSNVDAVALYDAGYRKQVKP